MSKEGTLKKPVEETKITILKDSLKIRRTRTRKLLAMPRFRRSLHA